LRAQAPRIRTRPGDLTAPYCHLARTALGEPVAAGQGHCPHQPRRQNPHDHPPAQKRKRVDVPRRFRQAQGVTMRQGWESEAQNWVRFARTPGHDHMHEEINLPALLALLPAPGRATLDLACGEGRLGRLLQSAGHRVAGIDAAAAMVRSAAGHPGAAPASLADAAGLPFRDESFDLAVASAAFLPPPGRCPLPAAPDPRQAAGTLRTSGSRSSPVRPCPAVPSCPSSYRQMRLAGDSTRTSDPASRLSTARSSGMTPRTESGRCGCRWPTSRVREIQVG
jgi:Methyltransferase domain